jgi:glycogen(starch) synthase
MNAETPVSIVINTLNRAHLLVNALESLRYLDYRKFEVVVVNGPSTDGTDRLLESWKGKIKIGHCAEANLSKSRNIGIAMAEGAFLAFIDDDAIPEPEWLSQAIAGFDSDDIAATGGKVFNHTGYEYQYQYATSNRLGNGRWQLTEPSPQFCFPHSFEFPYLQGTNTVFRRRSLLQVGGFDEEFSYYLDETEVCLRLIDAGYVIRQLPNAYVHHKYAPSHIRDKGVARFRYPVLKSKFYFSNRYGVGYRTPREIDEDNSQFVQVQRDDVMANVAVGRLSEAERLQFEDHVQQAWKLGKEASFQPQKLITSELLSRHRTPFLPFPTVRPDGKKLTIVLLCEDYPPNLLGGIARITQAKAVALAALGHKVHVIARSVTFNTVDFEDGVWVHRITANSQKLTERARALKVPQSHWDQSQSFLDEIDRIDSHRPVDIVETPTWNIVGIAALLSGRYKIVTSLQTTLKLSLESRPDLTRNAHVLETFVKPMVNLERYLLEESDLLLANSHGIVNEIEAVYGMTIPPGRLRLSRHGMPDWTKLSIPPRSYIDPPRWSGSSENQPIKLLFVGRLEKRKGIDTLLRIAPKLVSQFPQIELHIVGDDSIQVDGSETYRQTFERQHRADVGAQVQFHQKVSEEDLRTHYADCDIFIAPSRFESFGLIFVEAMMFAKPVVACRAGGVSEVVIHGETGLLAEPGDEQSLYEAVIELIENQPLRDILGKRGRERYEQLFSEGHMAMSSLTAYQQLLERGKCPLDDQREALPVRMAIL